MPASMQRPTTSAPSIRQQDRRYSSASTLCGIPLPAAAAPDRWGGVLLSSAIQRVDRAPPRDGLPGAIVVEKPGRLPPCLALPVLLFLGGLLVGRWLDRVLRDDVKGQLDRDVALELHLDRVPAEGLHRREKVDP